jgi:hypothetical protein|tara:strand:+ start:781 stop:942 length:162 start_codon:yes stop_codon:yes gene_type:complete
VEAVVVVLAPQAQKMELAALQTPVEVVVDVLLAALILLVPVEQVSLLSDMRCN